MMLDVKDLTVDYGRIRALENVSITIGKGEIIALLGANGSGKSTLVNAISGLLKPVSGEIAFNGKRIDGNRPETIVGQGLIQVPEGRALFPALTVADNIEMGAYLIQDKARIRRGMERVYALFPILKEKRGQLCGTLSGGQQQMVAIGRAILSEPALLMLDEPSLGLSPLLVEQIFEAIQRLHAEQDIPLLLIEQNVALSLKVSQRAYVMERGKVVLAGNSRDLAADPTIESAYLGF